MVFMVAGPPSCVEALMAPASSPGFHSVERGAGRNGGIHGLLQLAADGEPAAPATHVKRANLSHGGAVSLAACASRNPLPQSAIRGFLQWMGARGLPDELERRCAGHQGKARPFQCGIFVAGIISRRARVPFSLEGSQD